MLPIKKVGRATMIWRAWNSALGRRRYEIELEKKHNPSIKLYISSYSKDVTQAKAEWYISKQGYKIVETRVK